MLANHTPNQGLLLEGKHHLDSKETNDPIGKWANHRDPGSSAGERERGDTRGRAARLVPGSGHSAHLKTSLTRADAPAQPGGLPASCALSTRSQQRHRGSPGGNCLQGGSVAAAGTVLTGSPGCTHVAVSKDDVLAQGTKQGLPGVGVWRKGGREAAFLGCSPGPSLRRGCANAHTGCNSTEHPLPPERGRAPGQGPPPGIFCSERCPEMGLRRYDAQLRGGCPGSLHTAFATFV